MGLGMPEVILILVVALIILVHANCLNWANRWDRQCRNFAALRTISNAPGNRKLKWTGIGATAL